MTDSVRETQYRGFLRGQQSEGGRGRVPQGAVRSLTNMEVRLSDGAVVKRSGRTNHATFGLDSIIELKEMALDNQAGANPALTGANRDGEVYSDTAGLLRTLTTSQRIKIASCPDYALILDRTEDPFLWDGGTSGFAYPGNSTHDASVYPICIPNDRNDRSAVVAGGPFVNGKCRWYVYAFERADGFIGACPSELPGAALKLNYRLPVAGGLNVPVPSLPLAASFGQNIAFVRIYGTRVMNTADPAPQSIEEFRFIAKTSAFGLTYQDTTPDSQLGEFALGAAYVFPRAGCAIYHKNRWILGDLKSPRTALLIAGGKVVVDTVLLTITDPIPGTTVRFTFSVSGTNDPILGILPPGPWSKSFDFTIDATLGEVSRTINSYMDTLKHTGVPTGNTATNDNFAPVRVFVVGDPDAKLFVTDSTDFGGTVANESIGWDVQNARRWIRHTATAAVFKEYRNFIEVEDIENPLRRRPDLMVEIGAKGGSFGMNFAYYQGSAGQNEVLVGRRNALYRLVGDLVEVGGVPNLGLVEVSRDIGFWAIDAVTESPSGVYFVSHRGLEFFNGYSITAIALDEHVATELAYAIANDPGNIRAKYFNGRVHITYLQSTGTRAIMVYDEKLSQILRDPLRAWYKWTGLYLAMEVWNKTTGAELIAGSSSTSLGTIDRFGQSAAQGDTGSDITATMVTATYEPQVGRRVRMRHIRPRFKKASGSISLSIRLDDRAVNAGSSAVPLSGVASVDELMPLIKVAGERNPRSRRIEFTLSATDKLDWEVYGFDLGFTPSEGALVGATR